MLAFASGFFGKKIVGKGFRLRGDIESKLAGFA